MQCGYGIAADGDEVGSLRLHPFEQPCLAPGLEGFRAHCINMRIQRKQQGAYMYILLSIRYSICELLPPQ